MKKINIVELLFQASVVVAIGVVLITFSYVVGKVLTNLETRSCGLVDTSTGHCLDGKYQVSERNDCAIEPVAPCANLPAVQGEL